MTFKRQPMNRRAREPGEFDSFVPRPRAIIEHGWLRQIGAIELHEPIPKTPGRKRQAIRDSANGEECLVRLPGICRGGTEHTIWSHAPLGAAGKGMGIKALDLAGAYCCTACDAAVDQGLGMSGLLSRDAVLLAWHTGHMRSLVRLAQKGLI